MLSKLHNPLNLIDRSSAVHLGCFAQAATQQLAERRLAHAYGYVLCSDKWL